MRILQITPQFPFPPDSGGRIGLFNSIKYLSRRHSITLLSFVEQGQEELVSNLSGYCQDIITVPQPKRYTPLALVANLFSLQPYTVSCRYHPAMVQKVEQLTRDRAFDLVHIDHVQMAQYIRYIPPPLPVILREHNVESMIVKRFWEQTSNPPVRLYAYFQWLKLRRFEARICRQFRLCVMTTEVDQERLQVLSPGVRTCVIPSGVDTRYFTPATRPPEMDTLVTTGDFSWPPTADGLLYLVREIWPRIRAQVPTAQLYVVGPNPPREVVQRSQRERVIVTGWVSDVRPYIQKGVVFVVSTRIGSGIRLKVLEAMAVGRPVVSTPVGCEGIQAIDGQEILLAQTPDVFAQRTAELLCDPQLRDRLTENARRLIGRRYAWRVLAKQMDGMYRSIVSGTPHRKRRPPASSLAS